MAEVSTPTPEVTIQQVPLPYVVQKAIFDTIAEIVTLSKDGANDYAGYTYASIDAYYLKVVPIALRHGIRWDLTTTGYPRREGNIEWWGYAVTLHFVDDVEKRAYVFPEYAKIVIKHPLRGPQDTGATISYADKVFCRQFLKVPTGEGDGDEIDNRQASDPSRERPMENLPDRVDTRRGRREADRKNGYIEQVKGVTDAAALEKLLQRCASDLEEMERQDLGSYRAIMTAVDERRRQLAHAIRDRVQQARGPHLAPSLHPPVAPRREGGKRVLRAPE